MFWGLGPACDLNSQLSSKESNVLLIGQNDCRHVLKTLSKKFTQPDSNLKLFILENSLENVARSLLFLTIALEENHGLGQKSSHFLEIYGNTLLRPTARQYLSTAATRLVKIITNFNYGQKTVPSISLDSLKYKDRDRLEHIFKFWSSNEDFEILRYWDERCRMLMGTRYDSRLGVYDWDLHMRYRPYGADVVTTQEYKTFREKGVAFLQDDTEPCLSNPTMAIFPAGSKTPFAVYTGDVSTGPYPSYGLSSENQLLLTKNNGHYTKSATEISLWNVQQMLYETIHGENYNPPSESVESFSVKLDTHDQLKQKKGEWMRQSDDDFTACGTRGIEIIFLPTTALKDYPSKPHFQSFFDLVTVPQSFLPTLPGNWHEMCKPDCKVLVESSKYVLGMSKDALAKAKTEAEEVLKNASGEPFGGFDYKKKDFLEFVVKK